MVTILNKTILTNGVVQQLSAMHMVHNHAIMYTENICIQNTEAKVFRFIHSTQQMNRSTGYLIIFRIYSNTRNGSGTLHPSLVNFSLRDQNTSRSIIIKSDHSKFLNISFKG